MVHTQPYPPLGGGGGPTLCRCAGRFSGSACAGELALVEFSWIEWVSGSLSSLSSTSFDPIFGVGGQGYTCPDERATSVQVVEDLERFESEGRKEGGSNTSLHVTQVHTCRLSGAQLVR